MPRSISDLAAGTMSVSEYLRRNPELLKPPAPHHKSASGPNKAQPGTLHLVKDAATTARKLAGTRNLKAKNILAEIKDRIVFEFHNGSQCSRDISNKYGLPVRVVHDILFLAIRKEVKSARQSVPGQSSLTLTRRTA